MKLEIYVEAMVDSNSILLQECIHGLHRHACQLQNVSVCSVAFSRDDSVSKLTNLFKFDAVTERKKNCQIYGLYLQ